MKHCLFRICALVFGMYSTAGASTLETAQTPPQAQKTPCFTITQDVSGMDALTFTTKEALRDFLTEHTRTPEWNQKKPQLGEDMNKFMQQNPLFLLEAQTSYCCVEENAKGCWERLLSNLPGQTLSVEKFLEELTSIVAKEAEDDAKELNDPSCGFMLTMMAAQKKALFTTIFMEELIRQKKEAEKDAAVTL